MAFGKTSVADSCSRSQYTRYLYAFPEEQFHLPERTCVLFQQYRVGCRWPSPHVWTRVDLFFNSLLLADRCGSAGHILLPHAPSSQVSASIPQCTGDAGRNGLASTGDPAQLFDVGALGTRVQLLDHEKVPRMVAQVQYVFM